MRSYKVFQVVKRKCLGKKVCNFGRAAVNLLLIEKTEKNCSPKFNFESNVNPKSL